MKYEVESSDLKIKTVPLSIFLKIMGLTLEITEYETHYCAHCGVEYNGGGVMGSIIGFGNTPRQVLLSMVNSLNQHATAPGDSLYPKSDRYNGTKSYIHIDYKIVLDWDVLKTYFPKNLKTKVGV